jgi:hypothetical protein
VGEGNLPFAEDVPDRDFRPANRNSLNLDRRFQMGFLSMKAARDWPTQSYRRIGFVCVGETSFLRQKAPKRLRAV